MSASNPTLQGSENSSEDDGERVQESERMKTPRKEGIKPVRLTNIWPRDRGSITKACVCLYQIGPIAEEVDTGLHN